MTKVRVTKPEELVRLYDLLLQGKNVMWQNTADLSDLVSSRRDRNPEIVAFAANCEARGFAFQAERCFYLAKSYSLAGKRVEAYALYCHARSLAETAIQKFKVLGSQNEVIKELQNLYNNCRANSCIEHATGILEDVKAPENLSKQISSMSLSCGDTRVEKFFLDNLDVYESAVGDPHLKSYARIVAFPPPFQSIPRNPIVLDLAYNCIDFPSLENRMKKDKKGFISRLWG